MTETDKADSSRANGPKCPSCFLALGQRILTLFDPTANRNVQLFQCSKCRKHVWEDEVA
ncbi:hypothetical protein PMI42_07737 [Bradyrhizobium sp. YR681]|nr:hypothetical protein PMI42_07737 [Bradyrhizobium sp. YR681]